MIPELTWGGYNIGRFLNKQDYMNFNYPVKPQLVLFESRNSRSGLFGMNDHDSFFDQLLEAFIARKFWVYFDEGNSGIKINVVKGCRSLGQHGEGRKIDHVPDTVVHNEDLNG
jgi:hypothetical protein